MLEIVRILMDYEKDPAGVEEMPQFNWELKSDKRGVVQTAYQLQIAENRDFDTPVYDSGVTESRESAHIRPPHVELKSAVKYGVRVRIWAGAGDVLPAALAECEESAWCEGSFDSPVKQRGVEGALRIGRIRARLPGRVEGNPGERKLFCRQRFKRGVCIYHGAGSVPFLSEWRKGGRG